MDWGQETFLCILPVKNMISKEKGIQKNNSQHLNCAEQSQSKLSYEKHILISMMSIPKGFLESIIPKLLQ